jgi:hypothetical protein
LGFFRILRFPAFPQLPCRPARPEQLSLLWFNSSSGPPPKCLARHPSVRAPLLRISHRLAHSFRRNLHNPEAIPSFGLSSAFRVSHPLRGLLLLRPREFISPRKRPSAFPSGISPPKEPRQLFADAMPSCRFSAVALPSSRVTGPTAYLPSTPRKWDKYLWPTSRLCSP